MADPWRALRVGDRVRIVRLPGDFDRPGYHVTEETVAAYCSLVETGRVLTIAEIDEFGRPWTEGFEADDSWERYAADETTG
jgi:hypothetical protein